MDGVLRLEVLGPVLADHLDSRLGQCGHVLDRHVFRGGDDRDVGPDLVADAVEPRGDLLSGQGQGLPVSPAAARCAAPRRRGRRGSACRGRRAPPGSLPRRVPPARPPSRGRACGPRRCCRRSGPGTARDVVSHLVAARPDRRPDRGGEAPAQDLRGLLDDAVDQAPPACVQDGERGLGSIRPRHRDQHAVGAEREHRDPGLIRPEPVTGSAARTGLGTVDERGVRLEAERQVRRRPRRPRHTAACGSRRRARRRRRCGARG